MLRTLSGTLAIPAPDRPRATPVASTGPSVLSQLDVDMLQMLALRSRNVERIRFEGAHYRRDIGAMTERARA